jgi:glycosyltransferase involved in cell wall biosynthesis
MPDRIAPITLVIPTFNSDRTVRDCLSSIQAQTTSASTVVVVDDVRTRDHTREIAHSFGARVLVSPAGMAQSRNEGFMSTDDPYLLSIDSDMRLSPRLVEDVDKAFRAGADALTIKEMAVGTGYWIRARKLDKMAVEHTGYGMSLRAIRREIFEHVGGYDEALEAGEDLDLHRRVLGSGADVRHVASSHIDHDEDRVGLIAAGRKKYQYGLSLPAFESKHGSGVMPAGFARRLTSGMALGIRSDPAAVPGYLLLKFCEAMAGTAGAIAARRRQDRLA